LVSLDGPHEVVVVVDGIFLQRPELADLWDTTVWVEADLDVAAERALERDDVRADSPAAERERYRLRYFPAQRRYIEQQRPDERATFVFRNTDVREPELVRQPRPR
jgi:uridine kinase